MADNVLIGKKVFTSSHFQPFHLLLSISIHSGNFQHSKGLEMDENGSNGAKLLKMA